MRTGGRTRSIGTGEFVEEPVRWRAQALLMLLSVGELTLAKFLRKVIAQDDIEIRRREIRIEFVRP